MSNFPLLHCLVETGSPQAGYEYAADAEMANLGILNTPAFNALAGMPKQALSEKSDRIYRIYRIKSKNPDNPVNSVYFQ